MRKYLVIFFIITLLFAACDKRMDYDYYIVNNCDENIKVDIEVGYNNEFKSFVILPHEKKLVHHDTGINALQDRLVEHFFKKITIKKGNKISKVNYIDKDLWIFESTSKSHANSYLIVNPEDFEDE